MKVSDLTRKPIADRVRRLQPCRGSSGLALQHIEQLIQNYLQGSRIFSERFPYALPVNRQFADQPGASGVWFLDGGQRPSQPLSALLRLVPHRGERIIKTPRRHPVHDELLDVSRAARRIDSS